MKFDSVVDAFGGTGSVGYMFKTKGKSVIYNDVMRFNWAIGKALIENDGVKLSPQETETLLVPNDSIEYPTFIFDTFKEVYFTDEENRWLDVVSTNISRIENEYKRALAYFALFQSCLAKRPYNLFHRKNLYLRFQEVERSFGNKTTWDTPFELHFKKFAIHGNQAIFSNGKENSALNFDAMELPTKADLVYIDTPYLSSRGTGVDYFGFYHFLEGLINYEHWGEMINHDLKHKPLIGYKSAWNDKNEISGAFDRLFSRFKNSILVVSYRSDGTPTIDALKSLMRKYKNEVVEVKRKKYKYVLSNRDSEEVLLIGR